MITPRFYIDLPLATGTVCDLPRAATRHALRALRMQAGDSLTLFNGRGGEYAARICVAREPHAQVEISNFDPREAELPWPITIGQGLSSGDKMGWTIEKAVELGAAAIQPLAMARCVTRLSGERAERRREHWQLLAVAASEQCGRNHVAAILPVLPIAEWFATLPTIDLKWMLVPGAAQSVTALDCPPDGQAVSLLFGPEGGIAPEEVDAARAAGFCDVSLGPRVLRTETAAAAALAMLAAHWKAI